MNKNSTSVIERHRELQAVKSNTADGTNGLMRANESANFASVAIDGKRTRKKAWRMTVRIKRTYKKSIWVAPR